MECVATSILLQSFPFCQGEFSPNRPSRRRPPRGRRAAEASSPRGLCRARASCGNCKVFVKECFLIRFGRRFRVMRGGGDATRTLILSRRVSAVSKDGAERRVKHDSFHPPLDVNRNPPYPPLSGGFVLPPLGRQSFPLEGCPLTRVAYIHSPLSVLAVRREWNHSPLEGESRKPNRQVKADSVGGDFPLWHVPPPARLRTPSLPCRLPLKGGVIPFCLLDNDPQGGSELQMRARNPKSLPGGFSTTPSRGEWSLRVLEGKSDFQTFIGWETLPGRGKGSFLNRV